MTAIDWLIFIVAYMLYLKLQSWVIIGIYLACEGTTEVLPDGSERDSEMILYPLYKYLHQVYPEKMYYKDKPFDEMIERLKGSGFLDAATFTTSFGRILFKDKKYADEFLAFAPIIRSQLGIGLENVEFAVALYKMVNRYRFSKYVRKPIIGCVRCMASFWSLFTYALPMYVIFEIRLWWLMLWPVTICALSFLNDKQLLKK